MMVEGGLKNEVCLGFIAQRYRVVRYSPEGAGSYDRRRNCTRARIYHTNGFLLHDGAPISYAGHDTFYCEKRSTNSRGAVWLELRCCDLGSLSYGY